MQTKFNLYPKEHYLKTSSFLSLILIYQVIWKR